MKKENNEDLKDIMRTSKKILKVFYFLIIIIGTFVTLKIFKELNIIGLIKSLLTILIPLFLGVIIAWLLSPIIKKLEKKGLKRNLGLVLSYAVLMGLIILFMSALIPVLYNQIIDLVDSLPSIFGSMQNWIEDIFSKFEKLEAINISDIKETLTLKLSEIIKELSTSLPGVIINFLKSTASSIGTLILGLIIGFFLLASTDNLSLTLLDIIPKSKRKNTKELFSRIEKSLRNYVNGALIDSFVVFIVSSIAFAIIGIKAPLLFGLFCGLMNVIPYLGPYIGGFPAIIVGFSQGTTIGIVTFIAIAVIQFVEGNLLQTLIISKTTKLNPVTIIIGLLIFGHFFGIVGMLLSTPVIGVCKVIYQYFDEKYDLFYISR